METSAKSRVKGTSVRSDLQIYWRLGATESINIKKMLPNPDFDSDFTADPTNTHCRIFTADLRPYIGSDSLTKSPVCSSLCYF